jgi:hypothetical protein
MRAAAFAGYCQQSAIAASAILAASFAFSRERSLA